MSTADGAGFRPIIDAHVHLYDTRRNRHPWLDDLPIREPFLASDYRASPGADRIDQIVCIEAVPRMDQSLQEARWLAEIAAGEPIVGAIVAQAPVETGAAVRPHLEALLAIGKVTGIRRILGGRHEADPAFPLRPGIAEGLKIVGELGFVFDLAGLTPQNMDNVIRLVDASPDTRFVLDHAGRPPIEQGSLEPWRSGMRTLATSPNVFCKLSNLIRQAGPDWSVAAIQPYADAVIEAFGFDRLIFGTDYPVVSMTASASIEDSVTLTETLLQGVGDADKRKVFHSNAFRIYRIVPHISPARNPR